MVPSHLNQCWHIINWNKFQWNLNHNTTIFIQENGINNVICKMVILSPPQCVISYEPTSTKRTSLGCPPPPPWLPQVYISQSLSRYISQSVSLPGPGLAATATTYQYIQQAGRQAGAPQPTGGPHTTARGLSHQTHSSHQTQTHSKLMSCLINYLWYKNLHRIISAKLKKKKKKKSLIKFLISKV